MAIIVSVIASLPLVGANHTRANTTACIDSYGPPSAPYRIRGIPIMRRFVVLGLPLLGFLLTAVSSVGEDKAKKDAPDHSATALEPWASKALPGDVAKRRVENITTGE